jgi:hypothetical protein
MTETPRPDGDDLRSSPSPEQAAAMRAARGEKAMRSARGDASTGSARGGEGMPSAPGDEAMRPAPGGRVPGAAGEMPPGTREVPGMAGEVPGRTGDAPAATGGPAWSGTAADGTPSAVGAPGGTGAPGATGVPGGTGHSGVEAGAPRAQQASHLAPLLPHDEADKLAQRLQHAVAGFVDGPRAAVEEADHVLEDIANRFTEAVTQRRRTLRRSWESTDESTAPATDTEQLRLALRDYRELADRLLHH